MKKLQALIEPRNLSQADAIEHWIEHEPLPDMEHNKKAERASTSRRKRS